MSNQRIQARDMRSALRIAKERFGDQVNILANRPVPNGIELLVSTTVPAAPAAVEIPNVDAPIGSQERFTQRARQNGRDLAAQFGVDLARDDKGLTAAQAPRAAQPNAEMDALKAQMQN